MAAGRTEKLTKPAVDRAKPEPTRFIIWDTDLKGFGLRVEPTGHKTFIARYRAGGGRGGVLRQTTVGRYGTVTLDQARAAARKVLGAAATGGDPVDEKRAAREAGMTVAQICDWYIEHAEAGRLLGKKGRPIKASTLAMDRSRIEQHIKPLLGKRPVRSLTLGMIHAAQADIATGVTAKAKSKGRGGRTAGGSGVAGRSIGMLRTIMEHAARDGLLAENPAKGFRRLADKKRTARLSMDQLRVLGKVMREAVDENATGLAAIRAMMLTGFRRQEVLGIRPSWLLDAGGVEFPDTKGDAQVRPIGRAAMDVLKGRRQEVGKGSPWLFPADRGKGHFVGVVKVLNRLCRKAGLTGVTPHVLRHSFGSIAGELGYSELTIAGLLGHAAKGVTQGYVHLDSALVASADRVSAAIAAAMDDAPSAEVVSLASRRN